MMIRSLILAFVVLLFGACEQVQTVPATQLLISVTGDPTDVTSVEVQVYDEKEVTLSQQQVFAKPPPFTFAVVPNSVSPADSMVIVISAKNANNEVLAVSKTLTTFAKRKALQIDVYLTQRCRRICAAGQTCVVSGEGNQECALTTFTMGNEYNGQETNPSTTNGDGGPASGTAGGGTGGDMSGLQGGGTASMGGGTTSIGGTASMGGGTTSIGGTASMGGGTTSIGGTASMGGGTTSIGGTASMGGGTASMGGSAGGGSVAGGVDAGPAAECDAANPCTAGYQCTGGKCVSLCMEKQCDPNANCALVSGAATCTCKSGFTAVNQTGGASSCIANQTCAAAGCDPNSKCELDAQMQAKCTCNAGYTGTGKSCAPVVCPPLTVTNGTVEVGTGTLNQTATYTCSAGYDKTGGSARRCETTGMWSGTAPTCAPHECGAPPKPVGGNATAAGGTKLGATATYTCTSPLRPSAPTRMCTATGWSGSTPSCIGCGDGDVQSGETCDWANPIDNPWTCTTLCQRTSFYKACYVGADCGGGLDCYLGVCTSACAAGGGCPQLSQLATTGSIGCMSGFACFISCSSARQCPAGTVCSGGTCQGCDPAGSQCAGKTCVGVSEESGLGLCK